MPDRSPILRSVYTILALSLTAIAAAWSFVSVPAAPLIALAFAAAGMLVAVVAWCVPQWRRHAGGMRHLLVSVAGVGCAALAVRAVQAMVEASR